jgi:hypothetical protein
MGSRPADASASAWARGCGDELSASSPIAGAQLEGGGLRPESLRRTTRPAALRAAWAASRAVDGGAEGGSGTGSPSGSGARAAGWGAGRSVGGFDAGLELASAGLRRGRRAALALGAADSAG